jgi:protein SCO1/2
VRYLARFGLVAGLLGVPLAAAASGFDPFASATIESRPGAQVPLDAVFRDEAGHSTSLRSLGGGRPIVLAPVLHNCPNICGVTLGSLSDAVAAQPADTEFAAVAFGIDPRETPENARTALAALAARSAGEGTGHPLHALTGDAAEIASVTEALGYRYAFDSALGQYAHVAALAVLTPNGRLVRWLYGIVPDPDGLGNSLTAARENRFGSVREQLLLLCYRYDPVTGRYTLLVSRVVQVAGAATVLALASFVALALMQERRSRRGSP